MISNYEFCEGCCVLTCDDIIEESKQVKESIVGGLPLGKKRLGTAIKEIWPGNVKSVKKIVGHQTQRFYVNLKRKASHLHHFCEDDSFQKLINNTELKLPDGWLRVLESTHKISFIRHEKWSFRNQRVTTEFSIVKLASGDLTYSINSRGCEIAIDAMLENACLTDHPLDIRVLNVLALLDHSNLCQGFRIKDDATVIAIVDHESGAFQDMQAIPKDDYAENKEFRGFSSSAKCCVSCQLLHDLDSQRKERNRKNTDIKSNC